MDIFDHKRPTQGSAGLKEIFSLSVHRNEGNHDRNKCCKCLMRSLDSEKHVPIH